MSSPIRNPNERLGTSQSRELLAEQEAARELNRQGLDATTDNPTTARQGTVRLNALVDQATQRTQSTPQSEQGGGTSTIGATGAAPLNRTHTVDELGGHQQVFGTGETRLGPPTTPRVQVTANQTQGAQSFATNLDTAMTNALSNAGRLNVLSRQLRAEGTTGSGSRLQSSGIRGLGPDELLAEFLKLNINDPNENVETHNKLWELSTQLRQQGIRDAKKHSENARRQMKEAEAYAKQAEMIGLIVQIASIALTICTFGAGAVVGVAASAAAAAATEAAVQAAQQAIQQVAQEVVQEVVKEAVQEVVQEVTQEVTQEVAKEMVEEATKEATQKVIEQMGQEAFQKACQDVIAKGAEQGVTITMEQAQAAVTQQISNTLLPQVTQQMSQQLIEKGLTQSAQFVTNAGSQLAQQAATRSATTGMQGLINRAGDVLTNMNQGVAGQMSRVTVLGSAVGQGVAAGANYKAAEKMADARQTGLEATRARFRAEQAQAQIEQEGEIINTIMESKNQTIDAVMQMTNATWASRQQLLAATMAR